MTTTAKPKLLLALTLSGDCPSKKNSKRLVSFGKRPGMLSSKHYLAWEAEQLSALWQLFPRLADDGVAQIQEPCGVAATIYPATRRKSDLTNKMESVMDLLVKAHILRDDNWVEVQEVQIVFGVADKANPRVEVLIYRLDSVTALDGIIAGLRQQIGVDHVT